MNKKKPTITLQINYPRVKDASTYEKASRINILTKSLAAILVGSTMGCSVTSLQCGTDGESSFVNLNTTPKVLSQNAREMSKLCSFVYNQEKT